MDLLTKEFAGAPLERPLRHQISVIGAAICMMFSPGCGGSPASSPGTEDQNPTSAADSSIHQPLADSAVTAATRGDSSAATAEHGRSELWVDDKGQKWFGDVPMDVFFAEPYAIVSDVTPIKVNAAASGSGEIKNDVAADVSNNADAQSATRESSWSDLISASELDDEVKTIRNFLNENLQSVSNYNSSMLMIPPKAATLGALAGVAMELPDSVSWKDDAKYIRDIAKKMNSDTLRSGPKDQKRLFGLYETLSDILNRSRPADLEEPPASDGFSEVSEMRLLMRRMEEAEKRLKTEAGIESAFASRGDLVNHEATLMATLAKIVTLPGYGYEDDPKFKNYAGDVLQAALAVKLAATDHNFADYELALTKISTTCSSCHSDYKNN
ncbi:MAG: cytochrome c [Planctomycetaceae bacterium]|nr:cytochrome c [Planctomycetaceae bacterium]